MNGDGSLEAGLRRSEPPGPLPTESEPALIEQLRAEIAASGPLTFARFMAVALYDPEHGYYRGAPDRPTRSGDFLTAPETHPLFGAAVSRQIDEVWQRLGRPAPFVLREYGAGSGSLAAAILAGLRADGSALANALTYDPVEVNDYRRSELAGRSDLPALAPTRRTAGAPAGFQGVVLANEFLDALPVHRIEWRDGHLLERFVDWDEPAGRLVERAGEPSTPALAERLAADRISLAPGEGVELGQVGEVCLGLDPWLGEVAAALERGLVLVLDYGHQASALYAPERASGTLRAYAGQRAHGDPFIAVGRQDLTAHVDLTALEAGAEAHGLALLGDVSQADFLIGCGLEELVERIRSSPATTMAEWLAVRSAIGRFLDPAALGGFRAVMLGREIEPPLLGLARVRHSPY
jgi:SAM-dependent MidA family methyltransferase